MIIEIGKVIVDVQDSTVDPQSGTVAVDIDLINPENHARALTLDIEECAGGDDNLVCTECTADPARALGFTCTAAEQPDGSCRIALYSTNPSEMIEQGRGPDRNRYLRCNRCQQPVTVYASRQETSPSPISSTKISVPVRIQEKSVSRPVAISTRRIVYSAEIVILICRHVATAW